MATVSNIAQKQKEKWCGLEALLEAVARKRDIVLNPQVVPETKDAKCGLKLNPWKAAIHLNQKMCNHQEKSGNATSTSPQNPILDTKDLPKADEMNFSHTDNTGTEMDRLVNNNATSGTQSETECILIEVDPFVNAKGNQHTTLCKSSQTESNTTAIGHQFATSKISTIYCDVGAANAEYQSEPQVLSTVKKEPTKWPSKTISYVLPIESFNNFKVLIPTNKLEMQTDDGEIVVMDPCDDTSIQVCKKTNDNTMQSNSTSKILKQHKKNMTVLEMLTGQKQDQNIIRWKKYDGCYIYFTESNKKYIIDCKTGNVTCDDNLCPLKQMSDVKADYRSERIPKLERNLLIPWTCCAEILSKSLKYGSIMKCIHNRKNSSKMVLKGRLVLKRLRKKHNYTAAARFILCSTKFGSFMEKHIPDVHSDHNYIKRDFKAVEEKLFTEIKECLPIESLLDNTRLGILKGSVSYIQHLERKLKESLGILPPIFPTSDISSVAAVVLEEAFGNKSSPEQCLSSKALLENNQEFLPGEQFEDMSTTPQVDEILDRDANTPEILAEFLETVQPIIEETTNYNLGKDSLCDKLYYQLIDCAAIHCSLLETSSCIETNFLDSYKRFNGNTCDLDNSAMQINTTIRDILRVMHEYKSTGCFEPTIINTRRRRQSYELRMKSTPKHMKSSQPMREHQRLTLYDLFPDPSTDSYDGLDATLEDLHSLRADSDTTMAQVENEEDMLFQYGDDVTSSQDDVMFQMNYTDVNLNSLSKNEEGDTPEGTLAKCSPYNSYGQDECWKTSREENWKTTTKEESWKNCGGDNLFSPSLTHLHSEGELGISSP